MSTELANTEELANVPDYMRAQIGEGLEDVHQSQDVSRIKVVQKQADDELLEKFSPGDLILTPELELVAKAGEAIGFTPLFFWNEFCTWEPLCARGSVDSPIVERSTDRSGALAAKCASKDTWYEYHPDHPKGSPEAEKWRRRNVHHLCYLVILDHPEMTMPVVMSFQKGDFRKGARFGSRLVQAKVPIYGQRYLLSTSTRDTTNPYKGLDIDPDTENRWVSREKFETNRELHLSFKKLFESNKLSAGGEDTEAETTDTL